MTAFSANLGFLWKDLPLPEAIRAAKSAGFDAVECHFPYDVPAPTVRAALDETGLKMLSLNTRPGNREQGDNGLAAIPDRETEAQAVIDEAVDYAVSAGIGKVHVMAGFASGEEAHKTFVTNLIYAAEKAVPHGIDILIEPLNSYDAPGYFLDTTDQAVRIIDEIGRANVFLMFDCYHVQLMEGDLCNRLARLLPKIGHIQFASVPDRGTPDRGEVNYSHVFKVIAALGYAGPLGAEYRPEDDTSDSLSWLELYS